ncbi:hypothetical protein SHLA_25c000160 [Shinella sp. DD12]|jgi:hypothetical protein|nr:hypothetical protein SHLA_25c000160 [Shinella sp. DD12]
MKRTNNLIGFCLLATFLAIFGSVLSIALFSTRSQPTIATVDTLAKEGGM